MDLDSEQKIEITYQFANDPLEINVHLNNPIYSEVDIGFAQKDFIKKIANKEYSVALKEYEKKVGRKLQNHRTIDQYKIEAKNLGFSEEDSQALYVLKQIFRDSKDFIDTPKHVLTE